MDNLTNMWLSFIWFTLFISFTLAIMKGPLLSSWIFLGTMQLIAHIPLLNIRLPANANIFLASLLNLSRMNIEAINSALDDLDA